LTTLLLISGILVGSLWLNARMERVEHRLRGVERVVSQIALAVGDR